MVRAATHMDRWICYVELRSASAGVASRMTGARSRTEKAAINAQGA
jgi:hypothetical protein